jgi:hypothetical protein
MFVSRALVEAYISALPLTAVAIVSSADGRRCRILTEGEPGPGETIERQLYFKPSHAELVLSKIDLEGWTNEPAAAVVASIVSAATMLGAPHYALADLRKVAAAVVAEVVARVEAGRQNGDLKLVNRQYKIYRLAQVAKGERAIPYAKFMERWTAGLVRDVAVNSGAG